MQTNTQELQAVRQGPLASGEYLSTEEQASSLEETASSMEELTKVANPPKMKKVANAKPGDAAEWEEF